MSLLHTSLTTPPLLPTPHTSLPLQPDKAQHWFSRALKSPEVCDSLFGPPSALQASLRSLVTPCKPWSHCCPTLTLFHSMAALGFLGQISPTLRVFEGRGWPKPACCRTDPLQLLLSECRYWQSREELWSRGGGRGIGHEWHLSQFAMIGSPFSSQLSPAHTQRKFSSREHCAVSCRIPSSAASD